MFRKKGTLCNFGGLDPEDRQIAERLERLKRGEEKVESLQSDEEIKRRLMTLKGIKEETCNQRSNTLKTPKLEQEEVEDLLKRYIEETQLELSINSDLKLKEESIERRFQKLKTDDLKNLIHPKREYEINSDDDEVDDDDARAKKIVEKAIVEVELDKKCGAKLENSDIYDDSANVDLENELEIQRCKICNEDAVVICLGCDKSLYCITCFIEGHNAEMKHHKKVDTIKIGTS